MKKVIALVLAAMMAMACISFAAAEAMTYAEYMAAEIDDEVTIEGYVQSAAYNAKYGNVGLFLADADGAYYAYRAVCDDELAAKLTVGAKVQVQGFKAEWAGEVEVAEGCTVTVLEGEPCVAEAKDITAELGTETLIEKMNQKVAVLAAEVVAANEEGAAFLYNWDGSGQAGAGNDLYFNVAVNGATYTFTVESDECAEGTDVYTAVTNLKVGDVIDIEGFLYWYNAPQLHVHCVAVK